MQLAIIEFARDVLKLEEATLLSLMIKRKHPIIYLIDEFIDMGGNRQ